MFSKDILDEFEKRHGRKPFQPTPRHSGRYPWGKESYASFREMPEDIRRQEVAKLKEKGMPIETIAKRLGVEVEEVERYL